MTPYLSAFCRVAGSLLLASALAAPAPALAHHPGTSRSPLAGVQDGTPMTLQGRLSILEFRHGTSQERIYALVADDGTATRLAVGPNIDGLRPQTMLSVTGRVKRGALAVESHQTVGVPSIAAAPAATSEGTLQLLHADYFDGGTSRFIWSLQQDNGTPRELDIAIAPSDLQSGMRVAVTGPTDQTTLAPSAITVLAEAPNANAPIVAAGNAQVLVILLAFAPTPPNTGVLTPLWGQAWIQGKMFTGSDGVANYWSEASFGKQTLSGAVTPWLTASFQTPTTCDYMGIATEAKRVAAAAGYPLANYQKFVYVFTKVVACGWAGLGEVGGTQAWSNEQNTVSVIGHEIGHTFGLGHANSLPCNGVTIATNCPANRPEYGDPWDIMGNLSTAQVNAWQKNAMGWVPDANVAKHTVGTAVYTLSPLEKSGGSTYAVQIAAAGHRTYWVEYRDPMISAFDAAVPVGAVVHLGGLMHQPDRSEYGCWDTCFLDMVPATASVFDGGLAVGKSFVDQQTGVTINAVAKGAGGLTVSVASPPTQWDIGVYRKNSPSTSLPVNKFLLDYGSDRQPDAKITMGGVAGDIPRVGFLGTDGLSSLVIYRSGLWFIDTNRDGVADRGVAFGGAAVDIPLIGDVTGDGSADLILYRNGTWFVDQFQNGSVDKIFYFGGAPNDIPLVGDLDGDGVDDLVVYRAGWWFVSTKRTGAADLIYAHGGMAQDKPVLFDANGDGKLDLCVFRDGVWYCSTKRDGVADVIFLYGGAGDVPLVGKFY